MLRLRQLIINESSYEIQRFSRLIEWQNVTSVSHGNVVELAEWRFHDALNVT